MQSADGSVIIPRSTARRPSGSTRRTRLSTTGAAPPTTAAPRLGRLGLADPPPPRRRRPRRGDLPRPGPRRQRPDHLRRGQRRRRHDRLGLGRPGLSGPPQRAGPALQAALRVHGHRPQRPDPAQHGRQPGGQGTAPRHAYTTAVTATPRTWATRSARSTRPTGCRTVSTRTTTPAGAFNYPVRRARHARQHPGGQRRHRRPPDPAPQPAGRHAPAPEDRRFGSPGSTATRTSSLWRRPRAAAARNQLLHAQRRRRPARHVVSGTDANGNPGRPAAHASRGRAGGARPSRFRADLRSHSPSPPAINDYLNLLQVNLQQPRPGGLLVRRRTISRPRLGHGLPRDAADDNYNAFDPFPPRDTTGEVNDSDFVRRGRGA